MTIITLSGSGFTGATAVNIGAVPAAWFIVQDDSTILCAIYPVTSSHTVDITVTTPNGTSVTSSDDQLSFSLRGQHDPTITSLGVTGVFNDICLAANTLYLSASNSTTGPGTIWSFSNGIGNLLYTLPSSPSVPIPTALCFGPNGDVWCCDANNHGIWDVDTLTFYPNGSTALTDVCVGPDANLWCTDGSANVWMVTMEGTFTSHAVAGSQTCICNGPDGNLWVGGTNGSVHKVSTSGTVLGSATVSSLPIQCISPGPDGNIWCCDKNVSPPSASVYRVTPSLSHTAFALTDVTSQGIISLYPGSNGNLYGLDVSTANKGYWAIDMSGSLSENTLSDASSLTSGGICVGQDGWVNFCCGQIEYILNNVGGF